METGQDQNWSASEQVKNYRGQQIFNIVIKRESEIDYPLVILGAHYDSRVIADRDPHLSNRSLPVPGANDGASGVAVLRELARVIPPKLEANIWLVFFDAEDNGSMPGGEWIIGSRLFVESLEERPEAVVIVDMIGDQDLEIYIEKNSDPSLVQEIWDIAHRLGYNDEFISYPKHRIIDDHLPFVQAGIPAVDIIDFDYPYWHTTDDTLDKVSAESLKAVGDVVLAWLIERFGVPP
jgi:Zn-dependent M28 family amino/carboxypeptidase